MKSTILMDLLFRVMYSQQRCATAYGVRVMYRPLIRVTVSGIGQTGEGVGCLCVGKF